MMSKMIQHARNIYAAVKEAENGYIFSKSIHGKNLSKKEKLWFLLENDQNVLTDRTDENGRLRFRLKSCVDTFSYHFKELGSETGKEKVIRFSAKEKRIVSYNPDLAKKQRTKFKRWLIGLLIILPIKILPKRIWRLRKIYPDHKPSSEWGKNKARYRS